MLSAPVSWRTGEAPEHKTILLDHGGTPPIEVCPPSSQPPARPLKFINVSDANARKQVRSHVMREFMRRKHRGNSESSKDPKHPGAQKDPTTPVPPIPTNPGREQSSQDHTWTWYGFDNDFKYDRSDQPSEAEQQAVSAQSASPMTSASLSRFDPFESFPISIEEGEWALVNHFVCVLPEMMFRVPSVYNPTRTVVFAKSMDGPVCFQSAVMAYSSAHIAALRERKNDALAIKHRSKALSLINQGFQSVTPETSMDVLFGILALCIVEDRFGDLEQSWVHMRGAIRIIEKFRDTTPMLSEYHHMCMFTNWCLFLMTGYDSCALRHIGFEDTLGDPSKPATLIGSSVAQQVSPRARDVADAFQEFLTFLRNVEHVAMNHSSASAKESAPRRHLAFLSGSPLHRLLSPPPDEGLESVKEGRIQRASRFVSLCHLNATLWEYRTSFEKTDQYLKSLSLRVVEHALDWNASLEVLLLTLIDCVDPELDRDGRAFFTARMLMVAKRLSPPMWNRVTDLLMRCLTLQVGDSGNQISFSHWEDSVRKELFEAPVDSPLFSPAYQ